MYWRKLQTDSANGSALYFKGVLGGYYKCTTKGLAGAKEIAEFEKDQQSHMVTQLTLI